MIKRFLAVVTVIMLLVTSAFAAKEAPSDARAYVVMESETGAIIEESNSNAPLPCAGLVRLMSLLVIAESMSTDGISPSSAVSVSSAAAKCGGTSVFLDAGASYPLEELYKAAVICSANDAVYALAEHISGSEEAFIERMNSRAEELGISARFSDCTGLSDHEISAADLGIICCHLSRQSIFLKYSSTWLTSFTHNSGRETQMASSNILIKEDFDGMATASSASAGYCLAASKKSGSSHFICVVMGDSTEGRFTLARSKINAVAAEYAPVVIAKAGSKVTQADVDGIKDPVALAAKDDLSLLLSKADAKNLKKSLELSPLTPPLKQGDPAGKLIIALPDGSTKEVELIIAQDHQASTFAAALSNILHCWLHRSS